jgi:hypothetical protein
MLPHPHHKQKLGEPGNREGHLDADGARRLLADGGFVDVGFWVDSYQRARRDVSDEYCR